MNTAGEKRKPPVPKPDDPEQSKRFEDAARELQTDESGEAFERAMKVVAVPTKAAEAGPRKRPKAA
jgi:hypothetical protein